METVTQQLTEVISAFDKEQTRVNEETIQQLKEEHKTEITEVKQKLEVSLLFYCSNSNTGLYHGIDLSNWIPFPLNKQRAQVLSPTRVEM